MTQESAADSIPIDMVYTYVDGDAAHAEKRRPYIDAMDRAELTHKEAHGRFLHVGEIRYSVRSALRYLPWLRRIYIVTDAQVPPVDAGLIESGRVKIVDHRDIIPGAYLPTFNSVTIESLLHRIEGLSEIFLYNNDDFMHFSSVPASAFVEMGEDGGVNLVLQARRVALRRCMYLAARLLPERPAAVLANSFTQLHASSYRLLRDGSYRLGWRDIIFPRHFTNVYRKSTRLRLEEEFALQLDANRKHRFVVPGVFGYTTLAYTFERLWHPQDILSLSKRTGGAEFEMFDFTALCAREDRLWRRLSASRAPFACLNNIPQSGRAEFERVMRAKGLSRPAEAAQVVPTRIRGED